jgi:hypothetical protein
MKHVLEGMVCAALVGTILTMALLAQAEDFTEFYQLLLPDQHP